MHAAVHAAAASLRNSMSKTALPRAADIVIVGGGIIGTAIASSLAALPSAGSVVVIEKATISAGASWHAAGLLNQLRGSKLYTRCYSETASEYAAIEKRTGAATGWCASGSIRVASNDRRMAELVADCERSNDYGVAAELISPTEIKRLAPMVETGDLIGGMYVPSDGLCSPADCCTALARSARQRDATIVEGVTVTGVALAEPAADGRGRRRVATTLETSAGRIACGIVVNAAGLWARDFSELAGGTNLMTTNLEHQYLVTEAVEELAQAGAMPTLRDPCRTLYFKLEPGGKMVVGGWEPHTRPALGSGTLPPVFESELFEGNYDRFEQHAVNAIDRMPCLASAGAQTLVHGPIPVSLDGNPLIGWDGKVENMYVAAGFTAGIGAAVGVANLSSRMITEGRAAPASDLVSDALEEQELALLDPTRFGATGAAMSELNAAAIKVYGTYYSLKE